MYPSILPIYRSSWGARSASARDMSGALRAAGPLGLAVRLRAAL